MTSLARPKVKPYIRRPHAGGQSFYPDEICALYSFPKVPNPQAQVIAICELGGGYDLSIVNAQLSKRGLPPCTITDASVRGAVNSPGDPNGADGEVMLDIVCAAAAWSYCTGLPADLLLAFAPNDANGMSDATHAAAMHPKQPSVISWSWGASEDNWDNASIVAFENTLAACKAMGITVLASAGDNGATDGSRAPGNHVDYPASSQYVCGCGGTFIQVSGGVIVSETVWNDNSVSSATGGGISNLFSLPDYQKNVAPSGVSGRCVPDWAGNADPQSGYKITNTDGQEGIIGGTSAVSPLFAGLVAALVSALGKRFSDPSTLYGVNGVNPSAFFDVIQGNNGGFSAGPGYDMDTGLGRPIGTVMLEAMRGIQPPPPPPPGNGGGSPPVVVGPTLATELAAIDAVFKQTIGQLSRQPQRFRTFGTQLLQLVKAQCDAVTKKVFGQ